MGSVSGLIGENIWLLLVIVLIVVVMAFELGIVGRIKDAINSATQSLSDYLNSVFSFVSFDLVKYVHLFGGITKGYFPRAVAR